MLIIFEVIFILNNSIMCLRLFEKHLERKEIFLRQMIILNQQTSLKIALATLLHTKPTRKIVSHSLRERAHILQEQGRSFRLENDEITI